MWARPDGLDRLAALMILGAALAALGNGLAMLFDPFGWYAWVGTVKATGPANGHFIRDIGLAYLGCAGLLVYAAGNLPMRWGAGLCGAAWLLLHGLLHIWEVLSGICSASIFWVEAPGTLGPPLLALGGVGLQLGRMRVASGPMPTGLFLPLAEKMTWNLSPHLADFAAAPGHVVEKFSHFMALATHRHAASAEQIALARLGAVMAEDCGPCVEIAARGALRDGLKPEAINAALAASPDPGPGQQAFAFAQALSRGDPQVDQLGAAIEAEFGRAVRTELTIAAALVRVHPAFKRGLGYAQSCAARPFSL